MSRQSLPLLDGPITFAGAVSLETSEAGVQPWRLPFDRIELFEPALRMRARHPAGVRLTLVSDTASLELRVEPHPEPEAYDLLVDDRFHARAELPVGESVVRFENLPGDLPEGEHRIEVYLPQKATVVVQDVSIDAGASAQLWHDDRPKWTVYGSSITQCGAAAGPSETWPALVANRFDLNLTCLGYGGNCHMEPMVARMIRDRPADYISLCLGINVMGAGSLSDRTFRAAVIGLIELIREKHPATPMVAVSPIANPPRETAPNAVGLTLVKMRDYVREAVDLLRGYGDENLHYQDGQELFGPEYVKHMPDQLHPDAEGYRVLARRYGDIVMPKLGLTSVAV